MGKAADGEIYAYYDVTFTVQGGPTVHATTVPLTAGYTTFEDIRSAISILQGCDVEGITVRELRDVTSRFAR